MKKASISLTLFLVLFLLTSSEVYAVEDPTPSTNDENKLKGGAHVNQIDVGVQTTTLEFVQPNYGETSYFEYRTDGDTSQKIGDKNPNPNIKDGLYPSICESNNSSSQKSFTANGYVEVRMVFFDTYEEYFDWTKFFVLPASNPPQQVDVWPKKPDIFWLKNALRPGDPGAITFYAATHPPEGFLYIVWTLTTKENWVWNYEIAGWDSKLIENQLVGMYSSQPFSIIYGNEIIPATMNADGIYFIDAPPHGNWIIIEGTHEGPFSWEDFDNYTRIRDAGIKILNIGSGRGSLSE